MFRPSGRPTLAVSRFSWSSLISCRCSRVSCVASCNLDRMIWSLPHHQHKTLLARVRFNCEKKETEGGQLTNCEITPEPGSETPWTTSSPSSFSSFLFLLPSSPSPSSPSSPSSLSLPFNSSPLHSSPLPFFPFLSQHPPPPTPPTDDDPKKQAQLESNGDTRLWVVVCVCHFHVALTNVATRAQRRLYSLCDGLGTSSGLRLKF